MKQLHKSKWLLIGLILMTIISSLGNSVSAIAETLDSSSVETSETLNEQESSPNMGVENEIPMVESEVQEKVTGDSQVDIKTKALDSSEIQSQTRDWSPIPSIQAEATRNRVSQQTTNVEDNDINTKNSSTYALQKLSNLEGFWITKFVLGTAGGSGYTQFPTSYQNYLNNNKIQWNANGIGGEKGDELKGLVKLPRQFIYTYGENGFSRSDNIVMGVGGFNGVPDRNELSILFSGYDTSEFSISAKEINTYQMKEPQTRFSEKSEGVLTDIQDYEVTVKRLKNATRQDKYNVEFNMDISWKTNPYFFYKAFYGTYWYDGHTHKAKQTNTFSSYGYIDWSDYDWGNSLLFGTSPENDNSEKPPFNTGSVVTLWGEGSNVSDRDLGTASGSENIDLKQPNDVAYSLILGEVDDSGGYFNPWDGLKIKAKGSETVTEQQGKLTPNGLSWDEGIFKVYSNIVMDDGHKEARILRTQGKRIYNDVKAGMNEVYYEVYHSNYYPLSINKLDISKSIPKVKKGESATEIEKLLISSNDVLSNENYPTVKKVKIKEYPDTSKTGITQATVQVEEGLKSGKIIKFDYIIDIEVEDDSKITATPKSQRINLGSDFSKVSPYDLVTDVKLGSQALNKDDYTVSVQNTVSTDTINDKTAKVLITYKKDPNKTLTLDVPIQVLWGDTVHLLGSYSKSVLALSLFQNGTNYQVITSKGRQTDSGGIHETSGTYLGIETYTLSDFNSQSGTNLKQNYKIDIDGRVSKGEAYKLIESPLTMKEGDVLKIYHRQIRSYPGLVELYINSESQTNPNSNRHMINDDLYLQITKNGFKVLNFNQLKGKTTNIPIYSTEEYLDEHINEYIDLRGYTNISIKEFSQYPNTKASGQQKGKIIVEETSTTGKNVQYEYEVTFTIGEGELTYSAPKTLTFKEFTKSKSEQIIQRMYSGDLGLKISDTRGQGKQGNWRLTAEVNQSEELSPYLIFRDGTSQDKYLNQDAVEIYSQAKQSNPTEPLNVEVSDQWTKDTGILLKVPPKNNLSSKQYTSTITWNLVEGP